MNADTFNASDLIQAYALPNLCSVMPGNKVMLRSGGPEMTVSKVNDQGEVVCLWLDCHGQLVCNAFSLECLTCYGAK